ncbi:MAG: GNAT family N-acetyltransferase [Phycisphaerae bacterium]|nr:GNAT family N-acetyltransferase [Phycisphaerae bacterium]
MPTTVVQADPPSGLLRPVCPTDVDALYAMQCDPEANRMAGTKPRGESAFRELWSKSLADPDGLHRVIMHDGAVVGGISCFEMDSRVMVGYWIARSHWGRGLATRALAAFLELTRRRPLHAYAAVTNVASIRVLERCGFRRNGTFMGHETDRYTAGEVAMLVLDEAPISP